MTAQVRTKTVWRPQPGPQTTLLRCPIFEVLYGGARGGGKGLRYSEKILTPFGWKALGEIKVGSAVCATDGTVQHVIGYYPRGVQKTYRLTWSDGSEVICDEDHIWLGWLSNKSRKIGGQRTSGEDSAKKWTTRQIAEHYRKDQKINRRIGIPVISNPVVFNIHGQKKGPNKFVSRSIPPYILGALIGDGSMSTDNLSISCADSEIVSHIRELIVGLGRDGECLKEYISKDEDRSPSYRFPNNLFNDHLNDLGLWGLRAPEKFIPRIYLFSSVEERWELLRGLMDTDGWADIDGDCYFCSTSLRLIEDVRHLARSLGAIVTLREKQPTYIYKGEKKEGLPAYTLRIKMKLPERMFNLPRKIDKCKGKEPQSMAIWLDSIEPAGEEDTACIAVSHPNSLYIIDNFIVTHNTDAMLGDFVSHAGKYGEDAIGLCVRRERTQLKEMIERSRQIYGPLGAKFSTQEKQWRFPNGARLTFAYLENDADAEAYQGWNTCVAIGTRIKMADGSLKTIETISPGEFVLTLEGPKRVLKTVAPYQATCVRALVRDGSGAVVGEQTHPVWHPVLTTSGVTSLRTRQKLQNVLQFLLGRDGLYRRVSEPHPYDRQELPAWLSWSEGGRNADTASVDGTQGSPPPQRLIVPVALHGLSPRSASGGRSLGARHVAMRSRSLGKSCQSWLSRFQETVSSQLGLRRLSVLVQSILDFSGLSRPNAFAGVPLRQHKAQGSPTRYLLGLHRHDELALVRSKNVQCALPLQGCVEDTRPASPSDASDTTPTHSPSASQSWVHPYTGEERRLVEQVHEGTMELEICGESWVSDLCVEDANHYISEC
jgi:LAGLIDADG-like domain